MIVEFIACYLPSHAPLVAVGAGACGWPFVVKAPSSFGPAVVALARLPPAERALHFLGIGGATYLAAGGGASSDQLRAEGRWAGAEKR